MLTHLQLLSVIEPYVKPKFIFLYLILDFSGRVWEAFWMKLKEELNNQYSIRCLFFYLLFNKDFSKSQKFSFDYPRKAVFDLRMIRLLSFQEFKKAK